MTGIVLAVALAAQVQGRFPPDSLINVKVLPRDSGVTAVIAQMRNFTFALGVRCQFCHVGEEGMPLERFDFASDEKRTKKTAREMLRLVQEINRRVHELPEHETGTSHVTVTCATCHRGVTRPVPLADLLEETVRTAGADSAVRAYRDLRARYFGRAAYDFGEVTLNVVGGRLTRARRFDEALAMLRLNEGLFPGSAAVQVAIGDTHLARGDTAGAAGAYRIALERDPNDGPARQRLRRIGRQ